MPGTTAQWELQPGAGEDRLRHSDAQGLSVSPLLSSSVHLFRV